MERQRRKNEQAGVSNSCLASLLSNHLLRAWIKLFVLTTTQNVAFSDMFTSHEEYLLSLTCFKSKSRMYVVFTFPQHYTNRIAVQWIWAESMAAYSCNIEAYVHCEWSTNTSWTLFSEQMTYLPSSCVFVSPTVDFKRFRIDIQTLN